MRIIQSISLFSVFLRVSNAHSWVEQLMRVESNGTMVGNPGYIRGAVSRQDPAFSDLQMQHLLPPNDGRKVPGIMMSDLMCKSSQSVANYSDALPALHALSGDYIALRYQENGHVSLPQNNVNKNSSGKVYVYGTKNPSSSDKFMSIHRVWNKDGTGGDRRGRLLATRDFDDLQCYQINDHRISKMRQKKYSKTPSDPQGADLWCQSDLKLPEGLTGTFTLYWVWDWPSKPSKEFPTGQQEVYTSCMDVYIKKAMKIKPLSFKDTQDLNLAAIKSQLEQS